MPLTTPPVSFPGSESEQVKDAVYESFARIAAALSHPYRIRVLELLAQGERTVDEVSGNTPLSRKNASAQLAVLRRAGLVTRRREGVRSFYRLAADDVLLAIRALQALAVARLSDVQALLRDFFHAPDVLEPLGIEGLRRLLHDEPDVMVLDLRPSEEHRQGHIRGARSIPIQELPERLEEVPRDRPVVAYCRGPFCVWEVEGVRLLRSTGRNARRLGATATEWRLAGLETAA